MAYILYGPVDGSSSLSEAAASVQGDTSSWRAGAAVAGGQDWTGDGVPDLAVAASGADGDASSSGVVFVLPGVGM